MFSFPEACRGGGEQMLGWRSWNLLFFLPNLFGSGGGWGVEGVALFSYTVIVVGEG